MLSGSCACVSACCLMLSGGLKGWGSRGPDFYLATTPPPARGWELCARRGEFVKKQHPLARSACNSIQIFVFPTPAKLAQLVLLPSNVSTCLCLNQLFKLCRFWTHLWSEQQNSTGERRGYSSHGGEIAPGLLIYSRCTDWRGFVLKFRFVLPASFCLSFGFSYSPRLPFSVFFSFSCSLSESHQRGAET